MRMVEPGLLVAASLALAMTLARAEVTIEHPWVRGVVAGQSATGAFMTIRSTESTDLVRVSSPVATEVAIHKMVMADSMMSMQPVASLRIPAHGAVEFRPGTYHLMLLGLKQPLATGSSVPLVLTFRGSDGVDISITVQAPVNALTAAAPGKSM